MPKLIVFQHFREICQPYEASLLAVSKQRSVNEIKALYDFGQRIFGENRALEIVEKAHSLPSDIQWHLIGHLQRNKVSLCLPYLTCIQSLDSPKLWEKLNTEAQLLDRNIDCLLQIKVAAEETKYGWDLDELKSMLKTGITETYPRINITGVMGMASLTVDQNQIRNEFMQLKSCFDELKINFFSHNSGFQHLSMGMSGDYQIALEEGSTMIRIGTKLFEDHDL